MNMSSTLFWLGVWVNLILSACGFEVAQTISVKKKEIPARGTHQLPDGTPFLHWDAFWCQCYGDVICFSLMDGWALEAGAKIDWTFNNFVIAGSFALVALIFTGFWLVNVVNDFKTGKIKRGDWGFLPDGTITFAGRYHLVYFALHVWIILMIGFVFSWNLWRADQIVIVKMICAIVVYFAFAYRDATKLGLACTGVDMEAKK